MGTSKLIRDLRKAAGLSQRDLALALKMRGNGGAQLISNIERGVCHPPFKRVVAFAKVLGVNPQIIYGSMMGDDLMSINKKYQELI